MDSTDMNDIHALDRLLRDLYHTVRNEGYEDTKPAERIIEIMIRNVQIALSQPDDIGDFFAVIKSQYSQLFPPKCSLSEFYIWREDMNERHRLNADYQKINEQIKEILNRH